MERRSISRWCATSKKTRTTPPLSRPSLPWVMCLNWAWLRKASRAKANSTSFACKLVTQHKDSSLPGLELPTKLGRCWVSVSPNPTALRLRARPTSGRFPSGLGSHQPFARRARARSVKSLRHAPCEIGFTARFHCLSHRRSHQHWLLRRCYCGIHQHSVAAQLHCNRRVGRRPHPCVHQYGDLRVGDDELQVPRIEDPHSRPDQRS